MRLLVVGAGAVGGFFGARLAQAGRDVTFLVRPARAATLRASGLRIVGSEPFTIAAPQLEVVGEEIATYDAVILAVKAYSLDDAIRDIAPAVGPQTMIVPLLNGMRHLDLLVARFGEAAVLGGVSATVASLDDDGAIRVGGSQAFLRYGERAGGMSPRVEALDRALRDGGLDAAASATILAEMWRKWIMLASLGAVNALMRGTTAAIIAAGGTPVILRLIDEAGAVAAAAGFAPADDAIAGARAFLTNPDTPLTSSMYRDLVAGNRIEGEHIVGDLVERGRALGVAMPTFEAARCNLRVYEATR